jgi:hypothetical protein
MSVGTRTGYCGGNALASYLGGAQFRIPAEQLKRAFETYKSKSKSKSKSKPKSKLFYDRRSFVQSVLGSAIHLGPATKFYRFQLLLETYSSSQ